jgi:ABC-type transport system involved in cytochrome c biogenesis permease subunit
MILVNILNVFLPVLYAAIILCYGISFFKKNDAKNQAYCKFRRPLLILIILFQFVYFLARSITYSHAPITTVYEIMTLLAFSLSVTYLYIEVKTKVVDTGFFILLIAGILQLISSIFIKELTEINPVLRNWLLGFHVTFALIGYSAITISGIYGFLYILLYNNIKKNKLGPIFKRLPSLQLLERLAYTAIIFGFVFLTLTILIGLIWLPRAIKDFSYFDPKLIATVIIWLLYSVGLISKKAGNLESRTVMSLAFFGFLFAIISMAVVNMFLTSFHKFY